MRCIINDNISDGVKTVSHFPIEYQENINDYLNEIRLGCFCFGVLEVFLGSSKHTFLIFPDVSIRKGAFDKGSTGQSVLVKMVLLNPYQNIRITILS